MSKTQTIKFKAMDKFLKDGMSELENVKNSIIVYIDGEVNNKVEKDLVLEENRYTLTLSKFKTGGIVKIKVPENVIMDEYGNGNEEQMVEVVVDTNPPEITYLYSNKETDTENKTYTMEFKVEDRYYNDSNRLTLNNLKTITIGEIDLKSLYQLSKVVLRLETEEENDKIIKSINDEQILIGRKYRLVISNLDQGDGIDYTGAVTITIAANSVMDRYANGNLAKTITSGVYEGNTTPDIVDVVSPIIQSTNMKIQASKMLITLEVKDSSGINESKSTLIGANNTIKLNKLTEVINGESKELNVDIVGQVESVLDESKKKIGIKFTIEIPRIGDEIDAYLIIPAGIVEDNNGNKNIEGKITLATKLKSTASETTEDSGFLGNTEIKRKNIESIEFVANTEVPNVLKDTIWDVSKNQDSSIIAWYKATINGTYKVYIGSDLEINANEDSSYLFANIGSGENCATTEVIKNIEALKTGNITNMSHMFENFGTKNMTELYLGTNFKVTKATDMTKMFYNCGNKAMTSLDLGVQFNTIAKKSTDFATNSGTSRNVIYCGEALYYDQNNFKYNGISNEKIQYTKGKLECKYTIEWKKVSSIIDEKAKEIVVIVNVTGKNTKCKEVLLEAENIKVYMDNELATGITKRITAKSNIDNGMQYTILLKEFEQRTMQQGKEYNEWSGNISLEIEHRMALDEYGNGNLATTISDTKTNKNTNGVMFTDFIKPNFYYESSKLTTVVDTENNRLTVVFRAKDKYYKSQNLQLSDITLRVYNEMSKTWDVVNINVPQNSLTHKAEANGEKYTLEINNLPGEMGEKYQNYSGQISMILPAGKIEDQSGNKNTSQTITLGINKSDNTGEAIIIDVVNPVWKIENVQKDAENKEVTMDIIGTDKYFKESILTSNNINIIVDGEDITNTRNIKKTLSTGTELYEIRGEERAQYGVKYTLTIGGFEENERRDIEKYKGYSGEVQVQIAKGTIKDNYGNVNDKTSVSIGKIDYVTPDIIKNSSTIDRTNKTETIVFSAVDKYFSSANITVDDINVYVDNELAQDINKQIIDTKNVVEVRNGVNSIIGKSYTLVLSNFETHTGIDKGYQNWSGQVSIRIKEGTVEDKSGNQNLQETIIGDEVDFISPKLTYNYLSTDIDKVENTVRIEFSIVDKNYGSGTLDISDLRILINEEEVDWTKVNKRLRKEELYREVAKEKQKIGEKYIITIDNLEQTTKRENKNTLDYSGIITVSIPAGKIADKEGNKNNAETLTVGINKDVWEKISTYVSNKDVIGSTTNQTFTIDKSYDVKQINGWRILGTTEEGNLKIVSTGVVVPVGQQGYIMSGSQGYENAEGVLNIIGAINWGLVGIFNFNLVEYLFGDGNLLTRIVYILVLISGIIDIGILTKDLD